MTGVIDSQALARTYSVRTHDDPWTIVEEYREVMSYHDEHPDDGSGAVSTTFDLPRGRVHKPRRWEARTRQSDQDCRRERVDRLSLGVRYRTCVQYARGSHFQ